MHDKKLEKPPSAEVKFVNNGTRTTNKKKRTIGILDKAKDWILHCDLGGHQETVPACLAITSERPDIVL